MYMIQEVHKSRRISSQFGYAAAAYYLRIFGWDDPSIVAILGSSE